MKKMKKALAVAMAIMLTLVGLTSCGTKAEPTDVSVMALKGPTAMGMVKFMKDADDGEITDNNYDFTITATIDEVTAALVKGDVDIAAVPANMASVLYNNTDGNIEVLAINTLGVLYICDTTGTISDVADLKGKTIYASGKGATPEYALDYILEENGLDPDKDVTIEWKSEHSECVSAMVSNPGSIALLPEPFVTTAQMQNSDIKVALDLTEEWDKLKKDDDDTTLITGVVVANKTFIEEHPEAVENFMKYYKESVEYVDKDTEAAAKLVGDFDIVTEKVALEAIPKCNIVFIKGSEMKDKLSGYLNVLYNMNAASVGGQLPGDDFYYNAD